MVGCNVSNLENIPDDMVGVEIAAARYVYYHHLESVMEIADSFGKMIDWAKNPGYIVDPLNFKIQKSSMQSEKVIIYI
ncbi:hypothetical protein [Neobacillus terrae]|uniref:hypothetical protein n=1 Tax=Neobacillus terrae TaxID=3034837 RepID=UPI00140B7C02|nr:hypothetical protein [Neobacillus terrae]NHM30930.1 hypothetical protein [Neobacillus terrae]